MQAICINQCKVSVTTKCVLCVCVCVVCGKGMESVEIAAEKCLHICKCLKVRAGVVLEGVARAATWFRRSGHKHWVIARWVLPLFLSVTATFWPCLCHWVLAWSRFVALALN